MHCSEAYYEGLRQGKDDVRLSDTVNELTKASFPSGAAAGASRDNFSIENLENGPKVSAEHISVEFPRNG